MQIMELRALVAIIDTGQFKAAAWRLQRSPASITHYIDNLEGDVGCELLVRNARPVVATPAGQVVVEAARSSLEALGRAVDTARHLAGGGQVAIRIGHNGATGLDIVNRARARLDPGVGDLIVLGEGPSNVLVDQILDHTCDLALVRPPIDRPDLEGTVLVSEPLVVVVPARHPLSGARSLHLRDLADDRIVLPPRSLSTGYHDLIVSSCAIHGGFTPQMASEATTGANAIDIVAAGGGVAFFTRSVLRYCNRRGTRTLQIRDPLPPLALHLTWHRHNGKPQLDTVRRAIIGAAEES